MPRLRLGVALLVPPPVDVEVDALRRACGDGSLGRVPPHLTLVPPVNVREERLDEALTVLRAAAAATRPLHLELGPPQTFLPDNPVLLLAVGGDVAGVSDLRDRVFRPPLERPLTWPFVPHVTLVDEGDPVRVAAAADALAGYRASVVVERVALLREGRRDDGRREWRPLADAALAAPAVVGRGGLELELSPSTVPGPDVRAWADREWEAHQRATYGPGLLPDRSLALTARREGAVVGLAEGHVRGEDAYLAELVVAADARGQGVGGHLLAAFAAAAAEQGATVLALRCPAGGATERFYRERGFAVAFPLPAWRHGRDFVQLRRPL